MMKPLRVMVIEDTPLVLDLYHENLGKIKGISLVKTPPVETFDLAMDLFRKEQPDIVVTDLSLTSAHTEGFGILRTLKKCSPRVCVVLTTSIYSPDNHDDLTEHIKHAKFDAVFHKADLQHLSEFIRSKLPNPPRP
jgi:DNA-binding NtrC family response regulator